MIEKCFYINLENRVDRKLFIEEELSKSSFVKDKLVRFNAVDGKLVNPRNLKKGLLSENAINDVLLDNISAWGLSMTQGGLGVLLSYINLFEEISKSTTPVVTFEDDIEITDDFDEYISGILSELPSDFDFCYLGYGDGEIESSPYSNHLSIPTGMITCLPGLIVSPKGASRLLEELYDIDNQIDTAIYNRLNKLNAYVSNKRIALVKNGFVSDIQGDKNLLKNYKKQNYLFATIAYGDNANNNALKLSLDLDYFKQRLLVVSNNPQLFKDLKNVIVVEYPPKNFSYNDKIICFEEGLKYEDAVVYIDSDCRIFYRNYKETFTNFLRTIGPGYHPSWMWGKITRPDGGFFNSTDIERRAKGYGELALQISQDLDIDIDEAYHHQEGIIIISKDGGKEKILLDTWKTMSSKLDEFEINNGSNRIGIGEGNLIGLSIVRSGIRVNDNEVANYIGEDIKYNFFGIYLERYIQNYPDRKSVKISDGTLISSKSIEVKFEDKFIDLNYKIFQLDNNLMTLTYEWNKNNNVEFLDHEFVINDVVYHFNSEKSGEFHFIKQLNMKIYHTYDWYGNKNLVLIDEI